MVIGRTDFFYSAQLELISLEPTLGAGFQIGHSYFSNPPQGAGRSWFNSIIENEITPLLEEYWPANPQEVKAQLKLLKTE